MTEDKLQARIGDILGCEGAPGKTKTGMLTLMPMKIFILDSKMTIRHAWVFEKKAPVKDAKPQPEQKEARRDEPHRLQNTSKKVYKIKKAKMDDIRSIK